MPALYVRPIKVRYSPMPTPVASLMEAGIARANHWRRPRMVKPTKTNPSTKTAVTATWYGTRPDPWYPTTV